MGETRFPNSEVLKLRNDVSCLGSIRERSDIQFSNRETKISRNEKAKTNIKNKTQSMRNDNFVCQYWNWIGYFISYLVCVHK